MNWLFDRALAYRAVFLLPDGTPNPAGRKVLKHLARFCRANKPTVSYTATGAVDPLASARMDGRREVWLLINEHLHLDDRVLINLEHEEESNG